MWKKVRVSKEIATFVASTWNYREVYFLMYFVFSGIISRSCHPNLINAFIAFTRVSQILLSKLLLTHSSLFDENRKRVE